MPRGGSDALRNKYKIIIKKLKKYIFGELGVFVMHEMGKVEE